MLLPQAYRSLSRPSSPHVSEASTMSPYSLDHISLRSYVLEAPRRPFNGARPLYSPSTTDPLPKVRTRRSGLPRAAHATRPWRPLKPPLLTVAPRPATSRRQRVMPSSAFPFPRIVKEHPGANHAAVRPLRGDNGIRTHDLRLAKPPL